MGIEITASFMDYQLNWWISEIRSMKNTNQM